MLGQNILSFACFIIISSEWWVKCKVWHILSLAFLGTRISQSFLIIPMSQLICFLCCLWFFQLAFFWYIEILFSDCFHHVDIFRIFSSSFSWATRGSSLSTCFALRALLVLTVIRRGNCLSYLKEYVHISLHNRDNASVTMLSFPLIYFGSHE